MDWDLSRGANQRRFGSFPPRLTGQWPRPTPRLEGRPARALGVPTSTLTPSTSSRSQPSSTRSSGFASRSRSTSRSTSPTPLSSPRATLPKMRTFDACLRAAAANIAVRFAATRSPRGDRGTNLVAISEEYEKAELHRNASFSGRPKIRRMSAGLDTSEAPRRGAPRAINRTNPFGPISWSPKSASGLAFWWALEDSNLRPQPCEGCALTN